jgi:hypothetical protein
MKFNNLKMLVLFMGVIGLVTIACNKDDEEPRETPTFTLVSLTAEGIDLAGVTAAVDVPENAPIIATFSSAVNSATATKSNFNITNAENSSQADYTVNASGSTVTITPTDGWDAGSQLNIQLTTAIAGSNGVNYGGNNLSFRTAGIFVPMAEAQVLALDFDGGTTEDEVGNMEVSTVGNLSFVEDRRGTENAAAFFDGQGNLIEIAADPSLIPGSGTISFWFKTDLADYDGQDGSGNPQTRFVMGLGVEKGYFLEMGRRSKDPTKDGFNEVFLKYATDHVNIGNNGAAVPKATAWSEINSQISVNFNPDESKSGWSFAIPELSEDPPNRAFVSEQVMGKWTHLVMVVDATAQTKTFFINGQKWATFSWVSSGSDWLFADMSLKTENNDGSAIEGIIGKLALGFAGSSDNTATGWATHSKHEANEAEKKKFFKGALDQFRIFNMPLNDADVQLLYENEK